MKTARRRLSVMSDNKLVEGFENAVNLDENDAVSWYILNNLLIWVFMMIISVYIKYRSQLHLLLIQDLL